MDFKYMSDKEILAFIASNIEKKRINKNITAEKLAKKGGHNSQTFSNFVNQGTNVRLSTIIQIFRGLDELDKLQEVFEYIEEFSPVNAAASSNLPKRVRGKADSKNKSIKWKD